MCSGGRLSLVVGFGFGFGCNWGCSKTKGRWSSKVGARFTSVAKRKKMFVFNIITKYL